MGSWLLSLLTDRSLAERFPIGSVSNKFGIRKVRNQKYPGLDRPRIRKAQGQKGSESVVFGIRKVVIR